MYPFLKKVGLLICVLKFMKCTSQGLSWWHAYDFLLPFPLFKFHTIILNFNFNLIILKYFWLCWVLVAVSGLSLVAVSGGYLCCVTQDSHCRGFSYCGLWALGGCRLLSCSTGLGGLRASGIFLDQGSNLVPCIGRWVLNHWTTRGVPSFSFGLSNYLNTIIKFFILK